MSEVIETSDTGGVDVMDSPTPSEQPGSTPQIDEPAQAIEPEVTEAPAAVGEPAPEVVEPVPEVAELAPAQPVYTDEELRALGWTDQQIEWQRQSEQM
jgi:hypothetical protein